MLIYSLIAVRWDDAEALYEPFASSHSLTPFTTNGVISFWRSRAPLNNYRIYVIYGKTWLKNNQISRTKISGIEKVICTTFNPNEYLYDSVCRYVATDLPFDLQGRQ